MRAGDISENVTGSHKLISNSFFPLVKHTYGIE